MFVPFIMCLIVLTKMYNRVLFPFLTAKTLKMINVYSNSILTRFLPEGGVSLRCLKTLLKPSLPNRPVLPSDEPHPTEYPHEPLASGARQPLASARVYGGLTGRGAGRAESGGADRPREGLVRSL